MKILAIDSSGMPASAAILSDGAVIASYTIRYQKTHSQTLLPMIDEMTKAVNLNKEEIDYIAVSGGPGSFTGIRIGAATAKGIGLALNRPLISVPTLEGMAYNCYGRCEVICPMMDARNKQVFAGIYSFSEEENCICSKADASFHILMEQTPLKVEELAEKLNGIGRKVILLGDGASVYRSMLAELLHVPYQYAPAHLSEQNAASLAVRAFDLLKEGKVISAADMRPDYLRLSQAERVRNSSLQKP